MKKIIKKCVAIMLTIGAVLGLAACGSVPVSRYKGIGIVQSNTSEKCFVSFSSIEGTIVLKLKTDGKGEGGIHYTASLDEGSVTVSYEYLGVDGELFTINGGESVDEIGGYYDHAKNVLVIIKTDGEARGGHFEFRTGDK